MEGIDKRFGFTLNAIGSTSDYNCELRKMASPMPELPKDRLVVTVGYTKDIWLSVEQFAQGVSQLSVYQHPFEVFT